MKNQAIYYKWRRREWKLLREYPVAYIEYECEKLNHLYKDYKFKIQ